MRGSVGRSDVVAFMVLAVSSAALVLWLGRDLGFYHDEWAFVLDRRLTFADLNLPWNEHWVALHLLVYRGLVETIGTSAYWPYLAVVTFAHVAVAGAVYALVRHELSTGWAIGASGLMLFLGSGAENLFTGFQMGFVGGVAFGLWAVYAAPTRPWLAALLLTAGVATQGSALFFIPAVAMRLILERPRSLAWVALPVVTYGTWYVLSGAVQVTAGRSLDLGVAGLYVVFGIAFALDAVGGVPTLTGLAIAGAIGWLAFRRGAPPIVPSLALAILAEYSILAVSRSQVGLWSSAESRYLYAAAPSIIVIATIALSRLHWAVAVALLTVALIGNVLAFGHLHDLVAHNIACEQGIPVAERAYRHTSGC